ncbi:hypothetical protein [Acetobacter ascendens]|uniref:hypothetical protein n=1 Tax=Acetobacter ascendens TaxID=481146 RepID=UPI000AE77A98|nr:hypothetical protein [Acetobacter ascendens]
MSDSNTIEITSPNQDVSLSGASSMTGSNYYEISNPDNYHFTLDLSVSTSDLYATYDPTNKETIITACRQLSPESGT